MAPQDRLEDRVIARVGERSTVEVGVVRQRADRLKPHRLVRNVGALDREEQRRRHVTHLERALVCPEACDGVVHSREGLRRGGKRLGVGDARRHLDLMVEPRVLVLEGGDHRQDRHAVLVGLGAARGERPAVMDAVHGERDGEVDIARPQEVRVHRVHKTVARGGALRGDQGLREDLPAEDSALRHPLAGTGKDVLAGARSRVLEVERSKEACQGVGHAM